MAEAGYSVSADTAGARAVVAELEDLAERLPTKTERTAETAAYDQFSTPPALAYVAAWVADVDARDVVFEPSAGTGSVAVWAQVAGARVHANELSERRADVLRLALDEQAAGADRVRVTGENAEHAYALFHRTTRPNVVLMNPPFGNAAGRGMKVHGLDMQHIEAAARLLEPGGRLVAIVGDGRTGSRRVPPVPGLVLRASVGVVKQAFRTSGTTFATRLLVFDKPAAGGTTGASADVVTGTAFSLRDLPALLAPTRALRVHSGTDPAALWGPAAGVAGPAGPAGSGRAGVVPGAGASVPVDARNDEDGAADGRPGARPGSEGAGTSAAGEPGSPVVSDEPDAGRGGTGDLFADAGSPARVDVADRPGDGGADVDGGGPEVRMGSSDRSSDGDVRPAGGEQESRVADVPSAEATPTPADELAYEVLDREARQSADRETESVYDAYAPALVFDGAKPHPTPLVESAAMAAVDPPVPTYRPRVPRQLVETGRLSAAQLDTVVRAGQAHTGTLPEQMRPVDSTDPSGPQEPVTYRRGFFVGDGTGVGKGAQSAGVILDNWLQGRRRHVWLSENFKLLDDARRDWSWLGQDPAQVLDWSKVTGDKQPEEGVAFLSYATLRSKPKTRATTRLEELVAWLTTRPDGSRMAPEAFDGVVVFDEAHNMASALAAEGARGMRGVSQTAQAGIDLQRALPNARVVYVSATGATEVYNLAYAERLGLWGDGTAFASPQQFVSQVSSRGVGAMEQIARDLKALGLYTARSLSYDGVEYATVEHALTDDQRGVYDALARAWQMVLANINEALAVTGGDKNGQAKGAALSQFWGAHQRFFNQIVTSMQAPSLVAAIAKELDAGHSAVVQLVSTMEAATERAVGKAVADGVSLDDVDITPRDMLMQFVQASFPVALYEEYQDESGAVKSRPVRDAGGNAVQDPQAVAMRERLLDEVGSVTVPQGILDQIIEHFGPDAVAEVTGRSRRYVRRPGDDGQAKTVAETRTLNDRRADVKAFEDGKKRVLVFSQAGGTGSSYHADRRFRNHQRRVHFLAQPGWRADKAVQGFGRSHRSNQASAPKFVLVTTDLKAQARFLSSVARRLDQLGALTKGQRQASGQSLLGAEHNLETVYATLAIQNFFLDLYGRRVPGLDFGEVTSQMGLNLVGSDGSFQYDKIPSVQQFLNRLLSLETEFMNTVFETWYGYLDAQNAAAKQSGDMDTGLETIKAKRAGVASDRVVYTHPESGATTRLVEATLTHDNPVLSWADAERYYRTEAEARGTWIGYVRNKQSGRVYGLVDVGSQTDIETGMVTRRVRRVPTAGASSYVSSNEAGNPRLYEPLPLPEAKAAWTAEAKAQPKERTETAHLLTGLVLPIWDLVPGRPALRRLAVSEGERAGEGLLGLLVPEPLVDTLLKNLGQTPDAKPAADVAPEDLVRRVLGGETVQLAGGWRVERKTIGGEPRAEVTGYSPDALDSLRQMGMLVERIDFKTRVTIPSTDAGVRAATSLLGRRAVVTTSGGRASGGGRYASRGTFNVPRDGVAGDAASGDGAQGDGVSAGTVTTGDGQAGDGQVGDGQAGDGQTGDAQPGDGAQLVPYIVTLPDGQTIQPQVGGTDLLHPMDMPELVYLAEQLMGARPRTTTRLRESIGEFRPGGTGGTDGATGVATIVLDKGIFAQPAQAAAVLAHEIGHLVDFVGGEDGPTMARGNILGRLRALARYMRSTAERAAGGESGGSRGAALSPEDGKRIRTQALNDLLAGRGKTFSDYMSDPLLRGSLSQPLKDEVRRQVELEIDQRQLLSAPHLQAELMALSTWWRPLSPAPSAAELAYRRSAAELYADALSVLLVAPDELRQRAPLFAEAFFDGLAADKPEVATAYEEMQMLLSGGPEALARFREERVYDMFSSADVRKAAVRDALDARQKGQWKTQLVQSLVTRWAPILQRARDAERAGRPMPRDKDPRYLLEEVGFRDSRMAVFVADVGEQVAAPLREAGLTTRDLAVYMYLNRVATERHVRRAFDELTDEQKEELADVAAQQPEWFEGTTDDPASALPDDAPDWIRSYLTAEDPAADAEETGRAALANPRGFTADTAQATLDGLRGRLDAAVAAGVGQDRPSKSRYDVVEAAARRFADLAAPHLEEAAELGVYNRTLYDSVIKPNRYSYAAFRVLDFIEHPDYVSAGVKQGTGTLRDVDDVFQATLLKTLSLVRENIEQRAKLGVDAMMRQEHPEQWTTPAMSAPGRYERPSGDNTGVVRMWENGRRVERHTDPYVARSFEHLDLSGLRWLTTTMRVLGSPFRAGFITYNLTFGLFTNPVRDYRRMLKTINTRRTTAADGSRTGGAVTRRAALAAYVKESRAAWAYARGTVTDPRVRELLESMTILPPGEAPMFTGREDGLAETLRRYGLAEIAPRERGRIMQALHSVTGPFRLADKLLLSPVRTVTRFTEALPKFAGDRLLADRGVGGRERAHLVRTRAGTPNVTDRGHYTPVTNEVFMFSNVFVQGWRADIAAATSPKTRAGYWWRTFIMDAVPKLAMVAAASGWIAKAVAGSGGGDEDDEDKNWGAQLEAFYRHVPDYDRQGYLIVPLGWEADPASPDGRKARYLRVPHDDTARGAMGALWALFRGTDAATAAGRVFDVGADQVPGFAPQVELAGMWADYLQGENPRDDFRGQDIISRQAQAARAGGDGARARLEMLASTADAFGLTRLRTAMRDRDGTGVTAADVVRLPFADRIVKSSAYGLVEESRQAEEREEGVRASVRLGYDPYTRARYSEYQRIKATDQDARTAREVERYEVLSLWNREVYAPTDEAALQARADGDAAGERVLQAEMREGTRAWVPAAPAGPAPTRP